MPILARWLFSLQGDNGQASSSSADVQQRDEGEQKTVDGSRAVDVAADAGVYSDAAVAKSSQLFCQQSGYA